MESRRLPGSGAGPSPDRMMIGSEGALGILINDKHVGTRLRRIFTQVSRALEDAREAAPISSFVQVLLGVF